MCANAERPPMCANAERTLVDDTGVPEGGARAVLAQEERSQEGLLPTPPPEHSVLPSPHCAFPPRAKQRLLMVMPITPKARGSGTWSL